ncbi:MAG TPA: hypothetical protein VF250_00645 [Conexibacter sp.]
MRIVIVGATGNVGTSLLAALAHEPAVEEIVAIARRPAHVADARESWPTDGVPTLFSSRHKAETERMLDRFERDRPGVRVVRLRRELRTGVGAAP